MKEHHSDFTYSANSVEAHRRGLTKLEYVATHLSLGPIPPLAAQQLVGPPPEDQSDAVAMAIWAAKAMAKFRCMCALELLAETKRIEREAGCQ